MKHKLNDCKIFAIMTSFNLLDLAVATPLASCAVPPYPRVRARLWNGTDCSRRAREFSIVPANECHNLYEKTDPLAIQTGIESSWVHNLAEGDKFLQGQQCTWKVYLRWDCQGTEYKATGPGFKQCVESASATDPDGFSYQWVCTTNAGAVRP
jgi:hypothetical protein